MNTQISELKKLLLKPPDKNNRKWTPFISPFTEKPARPTQAKKIACIIVAGGLGTRLNFHAPKGLFPILGKSLLQIFAEKAQVHPCMRLAIMTSSATDGPIRCHFAKQANFGLEDSQIAFFKQKDLPFLTPEGEPIDDPRGGLLQGPDGNGSALKELLTQGIWEQWHTQGVEYVNFLQIDNPLLDPFDPILAALLETHCAEVAVRCVKRLSTEEKVGILIERRKKIEILEYTEIDRPLDQAYANISNFCFRMDFIKRLESVELPLHIARKKVDGREVIKFEKFIFDCLPFSKKTVAFLDSRRNCFAPLKEASGTFGPDAVEKALKERIGYDQSRSERNRREKK